MKKTFNGYFKSGKYIKNTNKNQRHKRPYRTKTHETFFDEVNLDDHYNQNQLITDYDKIKESMNKLYYMDNAPYHQINSFSSRRFYNTDKTIINLPVFILKKIIELVDLETIYNLSRTCWKMLLFSRTNLVILLTLNCKHINVGIFADFYGLYKRFKCQDLDMYPSEKYECIFYNAPIGKLTKHIHKLALNNLKNPHGCNNIYGYDMFVKYGNVMETILFGFNHMIFKYGYEYHMNKIMDDIRFGIFEDYIVNGMIDIHKIKSHLEDIILTKLNDDKHYLTHNTGLVHLDEYMCPMRGDLRQYYSSIEFDFSDTSDDDY